MYTANFPLNALKENAPHRVFEGGKFNHSIASFSAPFFALNNARIDFYEYTKGRHTIVTIRI